MDLPTIRQLQCLVAVAENLHFRRAAEACYITQPALSAQIQQLERLVGTRLFERTNRRVLPTAAGTAMAKKARDLLAQIEELTESAAAFKTPLSGILRLGIIPTIAPYLLPRALKEVHRRYPDLRLFLREDRTERLVQLQSEGLLDVLLVALESNLGDAETLPMFVDRFLLAVPARHRLRNRKRVREQDLAEEQALLLDDGHCLRDQALSVCNSAKACELGDFRASSLGTLMQMVSGGIGVTLIPEMAAATECGSDRTVKTIRFGSGGPFRTIGLAWRPSSTRKPEFRLLAEAIGAGMQIRGKNVMPSGE